MSIVDDARRLAEQAHAGQTRKGGGKPYIHHPAEVAAAVAANGGDASVVAAAWLHDVVEDTGRELGELRVRFGERIARLVEAVTEPDKNEPWERRKRAALDHLAAAERDVALLKACDCLANARDILSDAARGQDVWERFNRPRAMQLWWYGSVARLVRARLPDQPLAAELQRTVDEVCLLGTRAAEAADADVVLELVEQLFEPPGQRPAAYVRDEARDRVLWWTGQQERVLLLADDAEGRTAGYAAAAVDVESIRFGRRCWVEDLVTAVDARGHGLGAALLGAARAWARRRGCTHLELDTGHAREDAQRFYEREGGSCTSATYTWSLGW